MEILEIDKEKAINFIFDNHYSKILPRLTKYYLGIYDKNDLLGVITLGYGTQPLGTIKKIFYKHKLKTSDYLEIGKMCFEKRLNNNGAFGSMAMSALIKFVKKNMPNIKFIYTMADGIMGKAGYVYQASSFRYIGSFWTSVYMDKKTNEKIHPRSAKTLCKENALFENKNKIFWLTYEFCEYKGIDKIEGLMFRYIMPLNKEAKLILKEYDEYKNQPNPKDKDILFKKRVNKNKYEFIQQPKFNMLVFNHNYQKPKKQYQISLFEEMEL